MRMSEYGCVRVSGPESAEAGLAPAGLTAHGACTRSIPCLRGAPICPSDGGRARGRVVRWRLGSRDPSRDHIIGCSRTQSHPQSSRLRPHLPVNVRRSLRSLCSSRSRLTRLSRMAACAVASHREPAGSVNPDSLACGNSPPLTVVSARRPTLSTELCRMAAGDVTISVRQRLGHACAPTAGRNTLVHKGRRARQAFAMLRQVFLEGTDHSCRVAGANGIRRERFGHDGSSADDRSRTHLHSRKNDAARSDVTRMMNDHTADPRRVEELIHLSIVCQNEALLAETTVVTNADEEAVTRINPRRGRQPHVAANAHSQGPQATPTAL